MKKLKLDPESLTVETFDASDCPHVVALDTGGCPDTFATSGGPWFCAVVCNSDERSCPCG
jgi:hypothetical protein